MSTRLEDAYCLPSAKTALCVAADEWLHWHGLLCEVRNLADSLQLDKRYFAVEEEAFAGMSAAAHGAARS